MLFIQNLFRSLDVPNLFGALLPRHCQQPVQIIPADRRFRGHRRHQLQPLQFGQRLFLNVRRHAGGLNFFLQLVEFALFSAAQFLLNRFELFVEVILFLRPLHLTLDAGVDVAVDVQLFELDFENVANAIEALKRVDGLEQILLFIELQIRRNGVGKPRRIVHTRRRDHRVVVQTLRKLDELLVQPGNLLHQLVDRWRRLHPRAKQANIGPEKPFFAGNG